MRRIITWVLLGGFLIPAVALLSCAEQRPTGPAAPEALEWVGTEVLYRDIPGKHDRSVLFFLATWCGWCKKLKAETLTDPRVISLLNDSLNIAQIDPDSDTLVVYRDTTVTCRKLARAIYGIGGYPTMVFLNRDGDLLGGQPGYYDADGFLAILRLALAFPDTVGDDSTTISGTGTARWRFNNASAGAGGIDFR